MADSRDYMTLTEEQGSIHIAEDVIAAIAAGAVLDVEGVAGMMYGGTVTDLTATKKSAQRGVKGVKLNLDGTSLVMDLSLAVRYGHPIPEVAERVQSAVSSSVEAMTGCRVEAVNVHVGGVTLT